MAKATVACATFQVLSFVQPFIGIYPSSQGEISVMEKGMSETRKTTTLALAW